MAEKVGYNFSGKRILVTGAGKGDYCFFSRVIEDLAGFIFSWFTFRGVACTVHVGQFFFVGIGRATCIALGKCGAQVIGFSRTQADLDSLEKEVAKPHPLGCSQ